MGHHADSVDPPAFFVNGQNYILPHYLFPSSASPSRSTHAHCATHGSILPLYRVHDRLSIAIVPKLRAGTEKLQVIGF